MRLFRSTYRVGYLALPIEVSFHIVELKLSFQANAGLQYRVLVRLSKIYRNQKKGLSAA